ncbi:hypothetical protein GPECTOR_24g271 [Gonium pectorale]|uniref:C3H1-type domain-containing protein n=1 Tax=Gonium pectorale TaxID=33097 RepID=A0A150GGM3_GONPE|nr:hypothetical protein GPECTOR_24g271 [Gonium pectorale]|eukprot:KXZ48981.1 hypothetical protein GPECTOR_24g271 [Gonium pectorale]
MHPPNCQAKKFQDSLQVLEGWSTIQWHIVDNQKRVQRAQASSSPSDAPQDSYNVQLVYKWLEAMQFVTHGKGVALAAGVDPKGHPTMQGPQYPAHTPGAEPGPDSGDGLAALRGLIAGGGLIQDTAAAEREGARQAARAKFHARLVALCGCYGPGGYEQAVATLLITPDHYRDALTAHLVPALSYLMSQRARSPTKLHPYAEADAEALFSATMDRFSSEMTNFFGGPQLSRILSDLCRELSNRWHEAAPPLTDPMQLAPAYARMLTKTFLLDKLKQLVRDLPNPFAREAVVQAASYLVAQQSTAPVPRTLAQATTFVGPLFAELHDWVAAFLALCQELQKEHSAATMRAQAKRDRPARRPRPRAGSTAGRPRQRDGAPAVAAVAPAPGAIRLPYGAGNLRGPTMVDFRATAEPKVQAANLALPPPDRALIQILKKVGPGSDRVCFAGTFSQTPCTRGDECQYTHF